MLDLFSAAPKEVRAGPRTLLIGPFKLREHAIVWRWLRDHSVRPTVALADYVNLLETEEARRAATLAAVMEEKTSWPPTPGSAEGNRIMLNDEGGQRLLVDLFLRKYQPDLDAAFIDTAMQSMSIEDLMLVLQIAFGEDDFDPEALRAVIRLAFRGIGPPAPAAPEDAPTTGESSETSPSSTPA